MTHLRAQIEAVLLKYMRNYWQPNLMGGSGVNQILLDELLACYPQPSRKRLEKILRQQGQIRVGWIEEHLQTVIDLVMVWARGEEQLRVPKKAWCEHLSWKEGFGGDNGWYQTAVEPIANVKSVGTLWKYCPICGAKRPED